MPLTLADGVAARGTWPPEPLEIVFIVVAVVIIAVSYTHLTLPTNREV